MINKDNIKPLIKVNRDDHLTLKNTLRSYEMAKNQAESIDYPNRYELLEIYFDVINDSHLKSTLNQRVSRILRLPFNIINTGNNKINDVLNLMFHQNWFYKFLKFVIDAVFYGNSLIEIYKVNKTVNVRLIPREHIIPEFQMVKINPYDIQGSIDYTQPVYSKSLIEVNNDFDNRNLGELLNISKLVLIKDESFINWAQYVEIFGQPLRIATTDTVDPLEINKVMKFLEQMGRSGYMVKNSQTEVEFKEAGGGSSNSLYKDIEEYINKEISKQILGVTMLSDDGSSRSQSEVHERASHLITQNDIRFITSIINNRLIPTLRDLNIISQKKIEFKFDEIDTFTTDEKLEIDRFLVENFNFKDTSYFEKRYGVELEDFKTFDDEITNENITE